MKEKKPSSSQLLRRISEISFMVDDLLLYLNSHPNDDRALESIREYLCLRKEALQEYAKWYGPLTVDSTDDNQSCSWQWSETPWPWEKKGGLC